MTNTKKPSTQAVSALVAYWIALGGPDKCSISDLAKGVKKPRGTVSDWINKLAPEYGIALPKKSDPVFDAVAGEKASVEDELKYQVATLKTQLTAYQKEELTARYVRTKIMGLAETTPTPPSWLVESKATMSSPGVPTLLASDWHFGEVISPAQIGGVNSYNLEIAHERAKRMILTAIDLLNNHMVNPKYPGIVFALCGDMVSGDIHDELKETNDIPLIPTVIDLYGVLIWCVETLATAFGRVFVPCVTGNHGRNTMKIRAKDRAFTSFDWMIYALLEKHFANDKRITFQIPEGPDALYSIYGHRYLLTHGDKLGNGGDGMIGALGPVLRGDHKKRSRNHQIAMGYDTLVIGHWHQLVQTSRVIMNGSLCGMNEYSYQCNFPFEQPKQALWITHPKMGITFSMPVNVGEVNKVTEAPWVAVK